MLNYSRNMRTRWAAGTRDPFRIPFRDRINTAFRSITYVSCTTDAYDTPRQIQATFHRVKKEGPVTERTGSVTDLEQVVGAVWPLVQSCSAGPSACRKYVFVFVFV